MGVSSNSTVSNAAVDGAVNIVKIKTAGTGGTNGTYTNIPMRGDGSNGQVSITIASGRNCCVGNKCWNRIFICKY